MTICPTIALAFWMGVTGFGLFQILFSLLRSPRLAMIVYRVLELVHFRNSPEIYVYLCHKNNDAMMTVIKNFLTRNAGVTQIESGRHYLTVSTRVTFR